MATCDCGTGNKLKPLEKAELALELAKLIADKLLGKDAKAIYQGLNAFPDMAVRFVDALEKSQGDNFAYSDFAEAANALVDLFIAGATFAGKLTPLYRTGSFIASAALLLNDLTDANSPYRKLFDQITDDYKEPLTLIGDENANQLTGGELCDVIKGGGGNDTLAGRGGNDYIYGEAGDDNLYGDDCNDYLEGGEGKDGLYGGSGDDILVGDDDNTGDILYGDIGFDTYVAGNNDFILDTLGQGKVLFEGIDLTGKKYKNSKTGRYEDDDYVYNGDPKSKGPLFITSKDGSKSITIGDWSNEDLGIELLDNKDIEVSITESASASEGDSGKRSLSFTVTLSRALEDGESLDVSVSGTDEGSYTFQSGEQSKTFTHSWNGDTRDEGAIDHTATLTPSANYSGPSDDVKVTVKNSGTATVYDDDEDKRHDPLALDTNKDGFISTSDLETSGTYFDITGDGLRERVGWIKSEDALVTYDKNDNGQIDGISEVFGNMNESGFEELKRLIDSNHDNIIDRRDELFSRLQVWNDFNQDAKVQEGELQSLKDAGVTSIDLNYVSTNIEINGNLLTEASKYTDMKINIKNNHKTISTCQDGLWHVAINNRNFSIQKEVG